MMGKYTTPSVTMLELEKYALADSFLIDWENRKCHFDDERFIRLLELTGTDLSGVPVDSQQSLLLQHIHILDGNVQQVRPLALGKFRQYPIPSLLRGNVFIFKIKIRCLHGSQRGTCRHPRLGQAA